MDDRQKLFVVDQTNTGGVRWKWEMAWAVVQKETPKLYFVDPKSSSYSKGRGCFPYHRRVEKDALDIGTDAGEACDKHEVKFQGAIKDAEEKLKILRENLDAFRRWREEEGYGRRNDS